MKYLEQILHQMHLLYFPCLPMSIRWCRSFLAAANKISLTTSDCGALSLGLGVRFPRCVSTSPHRVPQRGLRERVSIYCSTYRPYGYSCYGDDFVQRLDTECECDPDVGGRAGLITQTIGIPQLGVLGLKRMTTQCSG